MKPSPTPMDQKIAQFAVPIGLWTQSNSSIQVFGKVRLGAASRSI
jgi:hypothetical protein